MIQLARRESELRELQNALDEAAAGRGKVVVVSGPVGMGKTTLLHMFGDQAARDGVLVLRSCALNDACTPFSVVEHLLRDLTAFLPDDAAAHRKNLAGLWGDLALEAARHDGAMTEEAARHIDHLTNELLALSALVPILLVVDDLNSVDDQSLGFLTGLIERIWSARVLVVAGEVTGAAEGTAIRWSSLVHQTHCRFIPLRPLAAAEVSELLAESSGFLPTAGIARRCLEITGGSPVLLCALAQDMNAGSYPAGSEPLVGDHFSRVVVSCLHRCAPGVLHIARAVAVLGDDASTDVVALLARRNRDAVSRAVDELTDMGLLNDCRFRHVGARAAALNDMTDDERSTLHGRAARLLYDEGASATVVARHLAATQQIEDAWGVSVLAESAQHALARGDVTLATSCLRPARESCSGKADCARLTAALIRVQWWDNPAAARRQLSGLLEELWAGYLEEPDALTVYGGLFWTGRAAEAARVLERLAEDGAPSRELARMSTWFTAWYPDHPAPGAGQRTDTLALSMDDLWQQRTTEGAPAVMDGFLCAGTPDGPVLGEVLAALTALVHCDPADKAVARCEELEPEVAGAPVAVRALFQACRALVALRAGDTRRALSHAEEALSLMPAESWGVALAVPLACAVSATTVMGHYEKAAAHLAVTLPAAAFDTPFGLLYLQARGQFYLATGRPRNGLRDLWECEQRVSAWRLPVPGLATWRSYAAQALVDIGEVRQARRLMDQQLTSLTRDQVRMRGMTLRLRAATEPPDHRAPVLSKAIGLLQQSEDRLELARAFAELAHTHNVLGEQALARTAAHKCAILAEECAAAPLLDQVFRDFPELRADDAPPPDGPDAPALSSSEHKVAMLASQGHTNRQIAKKLHVTVSTVEQHLTRVYRKLHIRRRSELTLRLALGDMEYAGPRAPHRDAVPVWHARPAPGRCIGLG
ncbi:ATP-binding protein [Streptomyces geranii]|uniref:ATP-binding protein n=1 Tax=Streptomyces geranii TaxID=2058923 RepID=UPI000D029774|nr:AAA family ATPase [Streptomyces geranii]